MTTSQGELASLSRFVFRAPHWYTSVGFSLLIAAFAGIAAFDAGFLLEDAWEGVFYIGVPTVVASLGTTPVDRLLGGQLTYNRSSLLALACEVIVVAVMTVAGTVAFITGGSQSFVFDALVASLALVFALRLLVVLAVSRNSLFLAAIPASIQTLTAAVLLFVYSGTIRYLEVGGPILRAYLSRLDEAPPELLLVTPTDFFLLGAMSVLYAGVAYGLVAVFDRPWKRALGVSILDFIRGFVGHIAEGSRELEEFFEEIGEEAVVPVTVLSFRRTDGTEKARFVLPMIHPGPMGEIGGGNLPRRVAEEVEGLAFPPHATAGHDFNLVTEAEIDKVLEAVERASEEIEYRPFASRSIRESSGDATIIGQRIGDGVLLVSTFSPASADDIEYSVGLASMAEARAAGWESVMLVDAHNSKDGPATEGIGHVVPGSKTSFDLLEAVRATSMELAATSEGSIRVGVAWDPTPWSTAEGIGPLGVRVCVVEVEAHQTVYVLVDGNNMVAGLRERVANEVTTVDDVEVMTTDTHVVNTSQSMNLVGQAIPHSAFAELVGQLVEQAIADLEPVRAGMATTRTEVTVFGNDRTEMLASHANAVIALGGVLTGVVVVVIVVLSILVFLLT